ncbi:hypothetical protein ABK046_45270, partial [Streptomyces caeruleatus]
EAYRGREALRDTQASIAAAEGDLTAIMHAVVAGAMQAVPAAEGGDELQAQLGGAVEFGGGARSGFYRRGAYGGEPRLESRGRELPVKRTSKPGPAG